MQDAAWVREFPAAITVCDHRGTLLAMNEKACEAFADDGGEKLIGTNALDCHPEPARSKLAALLHAGTSNAYTIEKKGKKKLIYQAPWYEGGKYRGLVELSLPIPDAMPHFVRSE